MDIREDDLYRTRDLLESKKRLSVASLRKLCLLLSRECTPYLGSHQRVARAFREFVEENPKAAAADELEGK